MATAYSTLLGLALPVQGELSGTWGDMVDNGITRYVDIAVAGTVTLTNDGAVTLSLTNGDSSATNIVSSLTGAGTVSAQFAIIKVTGTLTTAKVLTPPSSSRTYVVVNAATGSTVTVKASGQIGVSIAVGETAFVYFNGTDYVKVAGTVNTGVTSFQTSLSGLTPSTATTGAVTLAGTLGTANGGTGLTSFTSGGVVYASSTSALTTGSVLSFDGTNLGIGTNSPSAKLDITSASAGYSNIKLVQTGVRTWAIENTGTSGLFKIIEAGVSDRLVIDSSGNVGIGTSSPATKLAVASANEAFRITGTNAYGTVTDGTVTTYLGGVTGGDVGGYTGTVSNHYYAIRTNNTERMRIDSSGNVGIGTSSPGLPLDVVGQIRGTTVLILNAGSPTTPGNTTPTFFSPASGVLGLVTNGSERIRVSSTGGFSVGTTADPGAGAIYATGNITAYYSDARLKTVSGKIENALDKVAQLSGVYYTNNSVAKSFGYDSDEVQVGVLAQDVEAVLPQIVKAAPFDLDENGNSKSGKNYKTVQYERLVPLLIEAINELQAKVKALESK